MSKSKEKISLAQAVEEGQLEEDIYWVFQALGEVKSEQDLGRAMKNAPTAGAASLLDYAFNYRKDFFNLILPKALNRKGKDTVLRDDGRKLDEIFDSIYRHLAEEFEVKRKCPLCGRATGSHVTLFKRPQRAG